MTDTAAVDRLAETRAFNAELERLLATQPPVHTLEPEVSRRARIEGTGVFPAPELLPQGQDRIIPGPGGRIDLRSFTPETVDGVYLHVHGGGWVLGSSRQQDVRLWSLAQEANVAVVSVDYRLAPEHPYPAGPDDCEAAALWLLDSARAEFGTERLAIGGESAGAHLAAVTLLRLRDRHGITGAFRAANLVYGAFDLTMTPSSRLWGDHNLVLSTPIIAWFADCYLGTMDAEARRAPDVSPLYADLDAMPPALFSVGTLDPLVDDSLFMEARWRQAGNAAELRLYDEGVHAFSYFPISLAAEANADQAAFVKAAVAAP